MLALWFNYSHGRGNKTGWIKDKETRWGYGTGRTLGVGEADGERDGLGLALAHVRGGVPHPAAVRPDVGRELHLGDDCTELASPSLFSPSLPLPPTHPQRVYVL